MSRITAGDTVYVKPTNNIYTVLAAAGFVVVLFGLIVVLVRANTLWGGLINSDGQPQARIRSTR